MLMETVSSQQILNTEVAGEKQFFPQRGECRQSIVKPIPMDSNNFTHI